VRAPAVARNAAAVGITGIAPVTEHTMGASRMCTAGFTDRTKDTASTRGQRTAPLGFASAATETSVEVHVNTLIRILLAFGVCAALAGQPLAQTELQRQPIIDVHLHAYGPADWKDPRPNPVTGKPSPATAEEHMRQTLAAMDRYNIVKAIVSGPLDAVEQWRTVAPGRILASPNFGRPQVDLYGRPLPQIDGLRSLFKSGRLSAIGEVQAQYEGLSPSDPALEPYFALAEELDIPVGVHTGTSFPGTPYQGFPRFRVALGNPLLLEDLLVRHPKLRVFIAHGGEPWRRETIALMHMYQQVYMDVGTIWIGASLNRSAIDDWFREMFANDFGKRIMFGTDQMRWPDAIGMAIEAIESVKFLTEEQRRDIFYNNAARFLRLASSDGRVGLTQPDLQLKPTAPPN